MQETNMPAAEAATAAAREGEPQSYELAFHVLPTVAEGEVSSVHSDLKALVKDLGGELFDEEVPERFDLAYEVEKYLEGKHRRFKSAYFGWVRFRLDPEKVGALTEAVDVKKEILRYLLIRLTRAEENAPFRFHEALAEKRVKQVDIEVEDAPPPAEEAVAAGVDELAKSEKSDGEEAARSV